MNYPGKVTVKKRSLTETMKEEEMSKQCHDTTTHVVAITGIQTKQESQKLTNKKKEKKTGDVVGRGERIGA